MKKMITLVAAALMTLALSSGAMAASFSGKVTKNDGEKVTLEVAKGGPTWVKKGSVLSAAGGMPTVVEVKGKEVTLKFSKAKAAKIKQNMTLSVSEPPKGTGTEVVAGC